MTTSPRTLPSDEARRALGRARAKQELHDRRYTHALTTALEEVTQVYTHWAGQGHDPVTAAILTQTTLDNLPEGL